MRQALPTELVSFGMDWIDSLTRMVKSRSDRIMTLEVFIIHATVGLRSRSVYFKNVCKLSQLKWHRFPVEEMWCQVPHEISSILRYTKNLLQ